MQQATLSAAAGQIHNMTSSLESLAQQTVAHKRKFQFAVSQMRQFSDHFSQIATATPLNRDQFEAYKYLVSDVYKYYTDMFKQNTLQSWAQTALENSASSVPSDLCALTSNLQEKTACLDAEGANYFNSSSPQWLQLHILDLRAISASFQQFMQSGQQDATVLEYVQERLHSINQFFDQYKDHDALLPGLTVFSPIPVNYQQWRLKHTDLKIDKEIGSGVSAVVYSGTYLPTGEAVAIKNLKFKKLSGQKLQAFQRELSILATAIHPTVLRFIGATDTVPFSIVTEWMPYGSLYHDLHQNHRLDRTDQTIALFDIARGMRFLHSRSIIHRDLKSLNVLLDKHKRAKICDFGFSKQTEENQVMTMNIGTPHWMAPELLNGPSDQSSVNQYNSKVDVYAYAIVMWEVAAKDLPYRGLDATQIIAQVMMNDMRPKIPTVVPTGFKELCQQCWSRDPINRPSFAEIVRRFRAGEIFLDGCDKGKLMEYIRSCDEEEDLSTQQLQTHMSSLESSANHLAEFISMIENEGVPIDQVDNCWNVLLKYQDVDKELFLRGLVSFLQTKNSVKAADLLRKRDDIPLSISRKIASYLPTGDETVDESLVVSACKNGCPVAALKAALNPMHLKLALEVIAQKKCAPEDTNDVSQIALKQLSSEDTMLIVAALRCLVGIQRVDVISVDTIRSLIGTSNKTLKIATFIAATAMADMGIPMPVDLIDGIASKSTTDPFGTAFLVASCNNKTAASHLVSLIEHGLACPTEIALKILIMASKHKELAAQVANAAKNLQLQPATQEFKLVVQKLGAF